MPKFENEGQEKKILPGTSRDNSAFLNNTQDNSVKTKSNLIQIPSVTLPKGGGAMKNIDDKFSINAVNGTAAYSIPLPLSPGRNNFTPSLTLSYNSGGGNGPFGLGWSVDYPAIQRKTEKKLPEYEDALESDTFIFSGAEDLVPELVSVKDSKGDDIWKINTFKEGNSIVTRYRPRIEGGFARIEKVDDAGNIYWRVRSKENIVSVFGKSDDAKLFSPVAGDKYKIFRWCLEYSYDDKGNFINYAYKKEDFDNVTLDIFEKNRSNGIAPFTNIYLKAVKYSNKTAFFEGDVLPKDFLFELILDYGEHDALKPSTKLIDKWASRKDPFADYRSGFEIRTYRLCQRVLMFHHFTTELKQEDYLVRSLDLRFDEQPHLTYLESIIQTGYIWNDDGSLKSKSSLPPSEFSYFKPGFSREVKEVSKANVVHDPIGLDSQSYQWTDFYSEGISGILTEQASGWFYKENLGDGNFTPAKLVSPKPSFLGLSDGTLSIQELEANGKKYFVKEDTVLKGYFELTLEEEWKSFRPFTEYPNIDLRDPNLKYIDLNGDGLPDLLISQEQEYVWYASKGTAGYDDLAIAAKANDEEKGPRILFADRNESVLVAIADMSGDGLADIVLISYTSVCYYPNLGYGKFGAKVTVQMSGSFDTSAGFNPHFISLTDIDGSGTTDIIYTGKDKIQVWFNQSGNSLSEPSEFFNPFPKLDNQSKISFIDLLGNGTSCITWSSSLPQHQHAPLRYVDMMGGRKPHVMFFHKNNMGKEVTLEYKSSTQYYLEDKKIGQKWITKLPFPVQCVSKVIIEDKVSQTRFANEYSYHHGYYDLVEREFRGFALVVQKDSETYETFVKQTVSTQTQTIEKDFFQPAVITKSWFHTGAYINRNQLFHQLQEEYYPDALVKQGKITDPGIITTLSKYRLTETPLPDKLTATETIECFRALKGLPLRQEMYSDEGDDSIRMHPYSVTQNNYEIQLLQAKADQQHAVFLSHEKENLAIHYERNPADPRIAQSINIEIDSFGNVLESASIVYGRLQEDSILPTKVDRQQQTKQHVIFTQNRFTQTINMPGAYHLPVACESQAWELNSPPPADTFFSIREIKNCFNNAIEKKYEQEALVNEKRKIEHSKVLFLQKDLKGPMPFGKIDLPLLPYENYLLAFTPSLATDIFGTKTDDAFLRSKGRYVELDGDSNYWIKSGRTYFHPDLSANPFATSVTPAKPADLSFAKSNFYLPVVFEDNFGFLSKVFYDKHKLFIRRAIDAVKNESVVEAFNYRTLAPYLMRDANDNRVGVRFDEIGLLVFTFVMGKEGEFRGDLMDANSIELSAKDDPTTKMEYEFRYFLSNGNLPNRVKTSVREKHHYKPKAPEAGNVLNWLNTVADTINANSPGLATGIIWQDSYSYSDGSGHEVLRKVQAEPGDAHPRDALGKLKHKPNGKLEDPVSTAPALRWVGNGRTIVNNKGNPVKQYQPYFDSTPEYNTESELTELGFTSLIHYDALERVIKTIYPIGTFSTIEFDAWMQKSRDENDNVKVSPWYTDRISGLLGVDEKDAAQKTELHNETPSITYLDSLGRPFLAVAHNKSQRSGEGIEENFYYTRTALDIEGNAKSITDAKGHVVMRWKNDMLGNICYQHSMDAGDRWMLADVMGKPLHLWDSRKQIFSYEYDALHRPLAHLVNDGSGDIVFEKFEYGEGVVHEKALNVRGKLYKHFDTAGVATNEVFDYKGNLLRSTRRLLKDYTKQPNWPSTPELETEVFAGETNYDALNRPVQMTAPDNSIILPVYNEANLLNSVDVKLKGSNTITHFVKDINYNEKGQRENILYDNNTVTRYTYQPENLRLIRLLTTANSGARILQDLNYHYDPVGNITRQFDNAQKTIFYGGQKVNAQSNYLYDSLYRLIEAEGREHIGQAGFNANDNWDDNWSKLILQPNSPIQLRGYTQKYTYDGGGNIEKMQHLSIGSPGWTRRYFYGNPNNQLTKTMVGSQPYSYTYNEHGSMKTMPHLLQEIDWNGREEMQHLHLGGGGEAWYVYDSSGLRVRKIIERPGDTSEERIYIGGFEVYRERSGNTVTLERETLHVMDDKQRIALVETKKGKTPLIRYQYSNHLGSAALELDDQAKIISYEEYHPYGTTAYQATDASKEVPLKRYRYTGMERDEESGLSYHSARYYLPWLGRWLSCDPGGIENGQNLYVYVRLNPIKLRDITGLDGTPGSQQSSSWTRFKNQVQFGITITQRVVYGGAPPHPMLDFSQVLEVGSARKGFLANTFMIPFEEPTDVFDRREWARGENMSEVVAVAELGAGMIGPPAPPSMRLSPATGPAQATSVSRPVVISGRPSISPSLQKAEDQGQKNGSDSSSQHTPEKDSNAPKPEGEQNARKTPPRSWVDEPLESKNKKTTNAQIEQEREQFEKSGKEKQVISEDVEDHHAASNKSTKGNKNYKEIFEEIFAKAGFKLSDAINILGIEGHGNAHGPNYHEAILARLEEGLAKFKDQVFSSKEYRDAFIETMKGIRCDLQRKGSTLNDLVTKKK